LRTHVLLPASLAAYPGSCKTLLED
jgi:hypothetical protein